MKSEIISDRQRASVGQSAAAMIGRIGKLILSDAQIRALKKCARGLQLRWLSIAARSGFLSRLHVFILTDAFSLEARAVLAGQVKHIENRSNLDSTNYSLRRGIHRLEKGLVMPKRREVFGLEYIEPLVATFADAAKSEIDLRELSWAQGVLARYFATVGSHPRIAKAEDLFQKTKIQSVVDSRPFTPYLQDRMRDPPVETARLLELAEMRRSVRSYSQEPVSRQLLDQAFAIAALSPSACNRQPISFRVFDDPDRATELASLAWGTAGFAENVPCTIAIVGRLRAYPYERDRHIIYVDGGLAAMSLMLALETLGLASCPINWPDIKERELAISEYLKLDLDERVVMLMAVGKPDPDGLVPASTKQSLEVFRTYDEKPPSNDRR